jgi:histidine ammonia-lyase
MSADHYIGENRLTLSELQEIILQKKTLKLSDKSIQQILHCREYLDNKLESAEGLLYGINTGFGSLCNIKIPPAELQQLQENLVRSHACGVGDVVPAPIIRLMLILKIQSLSYGHSGVRLETVERLIYFYNNDLLPVVYTKGSLGASGDLAPLAHLSLPLLGEGELIVNGNIRPTAEVLQEHNIEPLRLAAKEGLALLNGTQFMSAYGCWCLLEARKLSRFADVTAALSADAYFCKTEPYLHYIHNIRPFKGQKETAATMLQLMEGSQIADQFKPQTQDPYAFRCIPQVHGASKEAFWHVEYMFETEINSVTDNPNVFPDDDLILSGGNFHGQPLAISLDYLAIALAELGNISERRTYNLLTGNRDLPEFLVAAPGLNSGLMIPQYTAASMVSENKQLCTPASVDSITSSNGQEDHVSMGANGAVKTYRVVQNLRYILAIEWLNAAQAVQYRKPLHTSPYLEKLLKQYRTTVPFIENDRYLHNDIVNTVKFLDNIYPQIIQPIA